MSKGDYRRPGKGYRGGWENIFGSKKRQQDKDASQGSDKDQYADKTPAKTCG